MNRVINRRSFLAIGAGTAVSMASGRLWGLGPIPMPAAHDGVEGKLDAFTADYMRAMNAPGMTQALTDTAVTIRTASYGFANVDLKAPVTPEHLFQIGSITKSFVALIVLQLHDEGKLDLNRPVLEYLPWLPVTMPYGPITTHHLLTHTSGLPDASSIFLSDPSFRHAQGFAPGTHFHYCNLGFAILGQIIEKLDGRPWYACLQARILTPMGMTATAPVITIESSARSAIGYQAFFDDQVYPRRGRLVPVPPEVFDIPAGSIAAPPGDMARYLRMLLNGGRRPNGRIVSEQGFALLSTSYIKAPEFSPTAFYGYGIALMSWTVIRYCGTREEWTASLPLSTWTWTEATLPLLRSTRCRATGRPRLRSTPFSFCGQNARSPCRRRSRSRIRMRWTMPATMRALFAVPTARNCSSRRTVRGSCSSMGRRRSSATGLGRFVSIHDAGCVFRLRPGLRERKGCFGGDCSRTSR
jgi:CubicO group peptidase (beta-lactamase class C family)